MTPPSPAIRRIAPWLLLVLAAASAASVALQFVFIHPFKPQTPGGLAVGAFLRDAAPVASVVVLLVAIIGAAWAWKSGGRWGRAASVVALLVAGAVVPAARVNVFEKMFAPVAEPRFVAAGDVDFLGDDDMVLAVASDAEAVAYPVRLLAYHHLVHDAVGGRALVATY